MTSKSFVSAILVVHDGATWIPEVIAAINNQTRQVDRIIAIDTGSEDASVTLLRNAGIEVHTLARDVGFGSAIDFALTQLEMVESLNEWGEAVETEWLWFIHDDCAPALDCLERLVATVEDRPNVAIVGPKLRGWYDRTHLLEVGVSIAGNGARWTGLEYREHDQGQHDQGPREVMAVSTAAMLARRSIFESVGGFDPNLELFRDDVDLGWRTHVAGYSVFCATDAVAYHVQASANERRPVDVAEAFLHRPLLLDRRNSAYVLLANSSWWLLPWIALQLLLSAGTRAIVNLLAKLPGYAGDELAAIVILLIRPADLIQARRERRSRRMISARVINRFIPPRTEQLRSTLERVRETLLHGFRSNERIQESQISTSYSDFGLVDESFDDPEFVEVPHVSVKRRLFSHPLFICASLMVALTLFASRSRYGNLSGGALPLSPLGAMDLIRTYLQSWHPIGMGSSVSAPPWTLLVGLSSVLTLGKLPVFISAIFWIAPPMAFLLTYRALRKFEVSKTLSLLGGALYALSPVVWASINQGRLGTLVLAILAPLFVSIGSLSLKLEGFSWRRIYAIVLFATALFAFNPMLLLFWTIANLYLLARILVRMILGTPAAEDQSRTSERWRVVVALLWADANAKRRIVFAALPWLLLFPWSAVLLLHPSQFFLEPGIPFASSGRWWTLLANPGGLSSMPLWMVSPLIIFLLVNLVNPVNRNWGVAGWTLIALAVFLASIEITGHGAASNIWVGPLLIFAQLCGLIPALRAATTLIPNLRHSNFGLGHITTALLSVLCLLFVASASTWAVSVGSQSETAGGRPGVVPAFLQSLAVTPDRPKTLVIVKSASQIRYAITRGSDMQLGEPDISVAVPMELQDAINHILSGDSGANSSELGQYGIHYLFMENPADQNLVRTLDGLGGFVRSSATKVGIIWKVQASAPRVLFTSQKGNKLTVPSDLIDASGPVPKAGTITLAEKFDRRWHAILNGQALALTRADSGLPTFNVTGPGQLTLLHDGTVHRGLLSIELLTLLTVVVLALPAGRRKREIALEDLV